MNEKDLNFMLIFTKCSFLYWNMLILIHLIKFYNTIFYCINQQYIFTYQNTMKNILFYFTSHYLNKKN